MMNPVVVIVGYNRIDSICRLMKSINEAYYEVDDVTLIVSLDYSDKQKKIEDAIKEIGWKYGELIIKKYNERQGLKQHILQCGDYSNEYGAAIILEDDLIVSPNYYSYVLQMLDFYAEDERICGVSLYRHSWNGYGNYQFVPQINEYDVFIAQIGVSWGQCWTKKEWLEFKDWYEKYKEINAIDVPHVINMWKNSWAKYFYNYMVDRGKYYVFPYTSLSTNFSEIGEHSGIVSTDYQVMLLDAKEKKYNIPKFEDAIKYDMYFERILDDSIDIDGIKAKNICVNLNGFKKSLCGKRYLLTMRRENDAKLLSSYGLRLRPIEQNVLKSVPGDDIYLYDMAGVTEDISWNRVTPTKRIDYELYGTPVRRIEDYLLDSSFDIDESAFDSYKYSKRQKVLERKANDLPSFGYTWMFHEVEEWKNWHNFDYAITPESFVELLERFRENGYRYCAVDEIFELQDDRNIIITFDDGYHGIIEYVCPYCEKNRIPFAVFITKDYIGKPGYLTLDEMKKLAECPYVTIGAHTLSHPRLRDISYEDSIREIAESKKWLEKELQRKIEYFAYPYGSIECVDKKSLEIVRKLGFKMAFSTLKTHIIKEEQVRYFQPRINVTEANCRDYNRFERNNNRQISINAKVKLQQFGGAAVDAGVIVVDNFVNKNDIVIYVAGVGEELNFEFDLLKALEGKNLQIYAFDPTPKTAVFIKNQNLPSNFHFFPYAIVDMDKNVEFAIPKTEGWVSGSCENVKNDERRLDFENTIKVEGRSISSIMRELGHDSIDLLKMDIEGSEFVALRDVFDNDLSIDQITVDYHDYMFNDGDCRLNDLLARIKKSEYAIYYVEQDTNKNQNMGLIRKDLL